MGGFLQVSGLKYTIDTTVKSSAKGDDKSMFVSVDGAYRVKNVKVLKNGKSKKITVFKYRPKKDSKSIRGHRQPYTKVQIRGYGKRRSLWGQCWRYCRGCLRD